MLKVFHEPYSLNMKDTLSPDSMTYGHKMETVKNVFGIFVDLKEWPWIFFFRSFLIVCNAFQFFFKSVFHRFYNVSIYAINTNFCGHFVSFHCFKW